MKKFLLLLVVLAPCLLRSEEPDILELNDIAADIGKYKNTTVTMDLRLKVYDKVFEKIVFYDKKNHDIEFDVSTFELKDKFHEAMLNLHEGLEYSVKFNVRDVGNFGMVIADVLSFKPVLLQYLPEPEKWKKAE